VALGVLRDRAAAEDVAQDVFLSFFVDPGALDRAQNVRAFVCRAALNRALDVRKAGLRRAARENTYATNEEGTSMSERAKRVSRTDPAEAVFRRELREKVWELPEIQRQAVDLHYFQGLTLAETAEVLDIPNGTASRRISDAVVTLRKWLSAAALTGLVAVLESELSAVEAAPVPDGLAARLLAAPRTYSAQPAGPRSALSGRTVRVAAALAVAMLFAVYTGKWIEEHDARWDERGVIFGMGEMAAAGPGGLEELPGSGVGANGESAASIHPPASASDIAPMPEVEQTLEGFLFRTPEGLFLAGEIVPEISEDRLFRREPLSTEGRVWRLEGGGLDAWPASDSTNFIPFLQDGAPVSSAPHSRVRLRARVPAAPQLAQEPTHLRVIEGPGDRLLEATVGDVRVVRVENGQANEAPTVTEKGTLTFLASEVTPETDRNPGAEAGTTEGGALLFDEMTLALNGEFTLRLAGAAPAPETATVLEVLEVELLTDSWLVAWKELYALATTFHAHEGSGWGGGQLDYPTLAGQFGEAIRHVRLARAGQWPVAWRIQMEHKFSAEAVAALAARGLGSLMPGVPTDSELRETFLEAGSPEALRILVEARWGSEVLALPVDVLDRYGKVFEFPEAEIWIEGGQKRRPVPQYLTLAELAALSPEDFLSQQATTRKRLAGASEAVKQGESARESVRTDDTPE
jgi:RNA polymerase sigma-70 factor, ECF subfamily